ncbi:hypothetical protein [Polaromonas sp. YR568]|uniref:phosphoribosyltransferase-like protein n=1 Tax=Polaromonas sp. YR568 TaxID=1855301 RepID=UPI0015877F9C|nr:hypothetical protein [Polaromonas sp. YR568]
MVEFNWRGWINNFQEDELPWAVRLLDSFLYFSQPLTRQLFRSAFLSASEFVVPKDSISTARGAWSKFIDDVVVVQIRGEIPSAADSGFAFARLARDDLGVNEEQLLDGQAALKYLLSKGSGTVVFVDDFVGSGAQFIKLWKRQEFVSSDISSISFAQLVNRHPDSFRFFYCTAVATTYGINNIKDVAPQVKVLSGQILDQRASALNSPSLIWREDMCSSGPEFIRRASERAGISMNSADDENWRGFHDLGLSVAFAHGWPDSTLPLYSWQENWQPLLVKGAV